MRKILSLCAAMLVAFAVNAGNVIQINNSTADALRLALGTAGDGDTIEMAAGTYIESPSDYLAFTGKAVTVRAAKGAEVILQPQVPVRLKSGAKAEFINIKFDCGHLSDVNTYENLIVPADENIDGKTVVLDGCEFYNWTQNAAIVRSTTSRALSVVTVKDCYIHNINKSFLFLENTAEATVSITNSTFANVSTESGYSAGVIDVRATTGSLLVDHCTFYDVLAMNTDYAAVGKVKTPTAVVSNCIFALSAPGASTVRAIRDAVNANNDLFYNYTTDSNWGTQGNVVRNAACVNDKDPKFVDAANGNFKLGEGSAALTMGTDGGAIGDPRWNAAAVLTEPDAAPADPTWPDNQVKAVYSAKYSADCGFGEWGSGTSYTQDTYGKKYVTVGGGYFGLTFENEAALNCSKMEKLHIDIWIAEDASVGIVPIHGGSEVRVTKDLVGQQWNSFDIALSEFDNGNDWSNTYQIKLDNIPNKTFWVNNVYFYTTVAPATDTEAPTAFTATLDAASYFSVNIKANATDNSGAVIFDVVNGELIVATANAVSATDKIITVGGLTPNTDYNFKVIAKDEAGNATDPIAVAAKTLAAPAPAAAPTYAADKVFAIYTDAYTNHLNDIQPWYASPAIVEGSLSSTSKTLCIEPNTTENSCFGLAFAATDITGYDALEMDVYATVAGVLTPSVVGVTPDPVPTYNLVAGQWNHIVLNIAGNTKTDCTQIGFYSCDKLVGTCFIQNVLFVEYVPMNTCAEVYSMAKNDAVNLNDVTVTYANGKNVWVRDATGSMLLYLTANTTWKAGDVLSGVAGVVDIYNDLYEVKPSAAQVAAVTVTAGTVPAPEELTAVATTDMNKYVILKGITTAADAAFAEGTASNITFKVGEADVVIRNNFKNAYSFIGEKKYDVVGLVTIYSKKPQIYFISAEPSQETAINNAVVSEKAVKMIENGQLIIMKNGVKYNAQGAELR